MEKVRWGVISTANIAQTELVPAIGRAANAEVTAIASRGSKVYEVAGKLNIPKAYESYEALLDDPEIDAVYIPLPNDMHKRWVEKAAEKGKHVLCEKPAAITAEETKAMLKVCSDNNVKFMEAFMYQFHPQHERVREIIASGEIGEVKLFKSSHSFFLQNRDSDIRMKKEMGGGAIYDVGCYCLHALRSVLKSEPVEFQTIAEMKQDVDLSAFIYARLENGIAAVIDCSFDMTGRNEYEVIGTEGSIKVPYAFRPDLNGGVGSVVISVKNTVREEKLYGDIYRLEVEHFSRAILEDSAPVYTGESAILNMQAIEACYESLKTGKRMKRQLNVTGSLLGDKI